MIKAAGLKPLHLAGTEGLFGERFDDYHKMNERQKDAWLNFAIQFAEDLPMVYNAKHLLSVAQRTE